MKYLTHENGKPSGTKTAFTAGVGVVLLKILMMGVVISTGDDTLRLGADTFDFAGAGVLIGALGAMLYGKKHDETKRVAQANGSA